MHFAPNGRQHYDLKGPDTVQTSCTHFRDGTGEKEAFSTADFSQYDTLAQDCMGPFLVWWWQNMPGLDNTSLDDAGAPMLNWLPFLYY